MLCEPSVVGHMQGCRRGGPNRVFLYDIKDAVSIAFNNI